MAPNATTDHRVGIPTLHTERLRLRAPAITDFGQSFAMWSDPRVTALIGGKPNDRQTVWSRLQRQIGHWCLLGYGTWTIELLRDDAYIGEVGFGDNRRDLDPALDGTPEMGWVLSPSAHGRGFATEAASAALAWKDAHRPGDTVCLVDPGNRPSLRVAEKLGFHVEQTTTYEGQETFIFRRRAERPGSRVAATLNLGRTPSTPI